MKFLSVLATICLLFFTSILILGVVSGSESEVNASISIEAPQVVILKELIDFGNYYKWCPNITKSEFDPNTQIRNSRYLMDGHSVQVNERVQFILSENMILFTERNDKPRGYMRNIVHEIRLNENSDGTTEIRWTMHYNIQPILSKILNIFAVRPALEKMLNENLEALKKKFDQ